MKIMVYSKCGIITKLAVIAHGPKSIRKPIGDISEDIYTKGKCNTNKDEIKPAIKIIE